MLDQRHVRFSNLSGLSREDLPLVLEIWLQEIQKAPWTTRDVMTLASYLSRYMLKPDPAMLMPWRMSVAIRLEADDVAKALQIMQANFAIEGFSNEGGTLRVATRLSVLQRLRVLETKLRLIELTEALGVSHRTDSDEWVPEGAENSADEQALQNAVAADVEQAKVAIN